jgi:hypothetical protein
MTKKRWQRWVLMCATVSAIVAWAVVADAEDTSFRCRVEWTGKDGVARSMSGVWESAPSAEDAEAVCRAKWEVNGNTGVSASCTDPHEK